MLSRRVILVVDDIEMNRALLRKIFEEDYKILEAEDGQEALKLLAERNVDMVLLDLSMPVMDGYQVIQSMKADQALAAIPIIVTTGAIDKSERRAFDLGADDFITKPYDPYIVRKRVENLIQKYVLQVDNLRQALSQAEQLNKAKTSFLSRMSHDLRSPINSIISLANLLEDKSEDAKTVRDYSRKIIATSTYLLGVINDILDVSAIENNKIIIAKSPFDFRRLMESVANMFYGQCQEKHLKFNLNLNDVTEEFLFGDPLRLKEILINLVSNAVKFTPAGGSINIGVHQLSRVDKMVKLRFTISDNGIGIAENMQKAIFKPFEQVAQSSNATHYGSGLGLSIVKNLAELMGGSIAMESEKGKGSSFSVDLPFTVTKELPQIDAEKLKTVKAIIIDDDVETQEYGQRLMKKLGISCDVASSGHEGLTMMQKAFANSNGYDICFIDWRMPGMTGLDITKAIRTTFDDDTVIVVASAYDMAEISQEAKTAGANVVVPKPMFQSTVFDMLMNITGGKYKDTATEDSQEYDFKGLKVLLAEDNSLNAEVMIELLGLANAETVRAVDGQEACELFDKEPPNTFGAILMDIQMPRLNGYEATEHIRKSSNPQGATIPIIAVTANAFTKDVRKSKAAGMNAHLAKPIDTQLLYETLTELIKK